MPRFLPVLVLIAIPALLPAGRLSELPVLIGALWGLAALLRGQIRWSDTGVPLTVALFLGYWLPELVSAFDALAPVKAWHEVLADLRFLPFLLFAVFALRPPGALRLCLYGTAAIVLGIAFDAWVQALTGFSLGGAAASDRLSGLFGNGNLKLGPVLAVLAPIPLLSVEQRWGLRGFAIVFVFLLVVILLAGTRSAWVMFALATLGALGWRYGARRAIVLSLSALLITLFAATIAHHVSSKFATRVQRSAAALQGDSTGIDFALSGRLTIWRAAWLMGAGHPVNGVGVRGFRVAYPHYALIDDPWLREGQVALHAHQVILEVWSETGGFGLLCWLSATLLAIRTWRRAGPDQRGRGIAPGLALAAMLFPLNTHYAFYSSFWSLLLFFLLAVWIGAIAVNDD